MEEKKYFCNICNRDLTNDVKLLGVDAWGYHLQFHRDSLLTTEIKRLREFIRQSYEGSTFLHKQQIKNILSETSEEIKSILDE